jgi:hypothetical protein
VLVRPRRFSNDPLSLFSPSPSCTAPFVPQASASSTRLCKPLFSQTDTTWPVRECLSGTAGSHSLDASVALFLQPSDRALTLGDDAGEASRVPVGRGRLGHATALDAGPLLPSFTPRQPIHHTSLRLHCGRQRRVSTLTGRVITASSYLALVSEKGRCLSIKSFARSVTILFSFKLKGSRKGVD